MIIRVEAPMPRAYLLICNLRDFICRETNNENGPQKKRGPFSLLVEMKRIELSTFALRIVVLNI